jgi:hypothetical protein
VRWPQSRNLTELDYVQQDDPLIGIAAGEFGLESVRVRCNGG